MEVNKLEGKRYYSLYTDNNDHTAELYIFGDIVDSFSTGIEEAWNEDFGNVSSLSIAKELQQLDVDQINVHISSEGGYTSEGLAIYNLLKQSKAKIVTYCDGFACSAASLIFMAGDERVMGIASALMIHNAWCGASGNSAQLRQQADVLDKISTIAGNVYAKKVTISRDELDTMLDGENHEGTWIDPEEAVSMGFATSINQDQAESSVANQSARIQILQKMRQKSLKIDEDAVLKWVADKWKSQPKLLGAKQPEENKSLNFLKGLISK